MVLPKSKWLTLVIAACFAILQAMQPLIHAHLDAEHPIHNSGVHVGDEHEEVAHETNIDSGLSEAPHISHTISVASGIKKDVEVSVLDPISIAVILFAVALLLTSYPIAKPQPTLLLRQFLRRRLPASRAPPLL